MAEDMAARVLRNVLAQPSDDRPALPFYRDPNAPVILPPSPVPVPVPEPVKPKPKVQTKRFCNPQRHKPFHLYMDSCLICKWFCNCCHTHGPKPPDVIVRSVDQKLVRLSGWLVRSSHTLMALLNTALINNAGGGAALKEEPVFAFSDDNNVRSGINYLPADDGVVSLCLSRLMLTDKDEGLLEYEDRVLVLFDTNSKRPTLGITQEILLKVNSYVCSHLDEMERRVESKLKFKRFLDESGHVEVAEADEWLTFKYEDWEEEFFNVDAGTFLDLVQASHELQIWDLYWATEKWTILNRGFPVQMKNGEYDITVDPDYMNHDRRCIFGLYNTKYHVYNPRVCKSYRRCGRANVFDEKDFYHPNFIAKWWIMKWMYIPDKPIRRKIIKKQNP